MVEYWSSMRHALPSGHFGTHFQNARVRAVIDVTQRISLAS